MNDISLGHLQTDFRDVVLCGDNRDVLDTLPKEYVDMIVTSPPYYGQRNYDHEDQIGAEKTPQDYIDDLVKVFSKARRVLRNDGTLWLNLGDKYLDGQLSGMPWRCALALVDDGWILRSDIIWHKPNAMPSSVKSRPTTDHEYIFLFSKSRKYFYNSDAIREPHVTFGENSKMRGGRRHLGKIDGTPENGKNKGNANLHRGRWDQAFHPKGRNKRTVWNVPLSKFREAHFAVFPEKLIEPCILAGSTKEGIVLDPFFGAGTTGVAAKKNGRSYLGIELNKKYCDIAEKRISEILL